MLRNQEKNNDNGHYRIHTETIVEMGQTYSKNEQRVSKQSCSNIQLSSKDGYKKNVPITGVAHHQFQSKFWTYFLPVKQQNYPDLQERTTL